MQSKINIYVNNTGGTDINKISDIIKSFEEHFIIYVVDTSSQTFGKIVEKRKEKYIVISENMEDFKNFKTGVKIFNQISRYPTERVKHDDFDNMYYVFDYEQMNDIIEASINLNLANRCYISLIKE